MKIRDRSRIEGFDLGIGILMIVTSLYHMVKTQQVGISLLDGTFLVVGIASIFSYFTFSLKESKDERGKHIKQVSGYISYLLTLVFLFAIVMLVQWGVIQSTNTAMILMFVIPLLTMPVVMFIYQKKL